MNRELLDVQAGFRKGKETRDQIANIHWIIQKAREFQKNICFIGYTNVFDCVDHNKLWKTLKRWEYQIIMRVRKQQLEPYMEQPTVSKLRKKDKVYLSPCLFNLYAEYVMQNARLNELQAEIETANWNINNLKYAEDTTLVAESEKELDETW